MGVHSCLVQLVSFLCSFYQNRNRCAVLVHICDNAPSLLSSFIDENFLFIYLLFLFFFIVMVFVIH